MSNGSDTAAEEALLMELAQLGMGLARQLHAATLATTDAERLVPLATAYCQVSRGVRQSLALKARFASGTVAIERASRSDATPSAPAEPRPEVERPDWKEYERPDWNERFVTGPEPLDVDLTIDDVDACRARIRRDLTIVSRTPALAAIPALRAPASAIAGRAALLGGAALRVVNTS